MTEARGGHVSYSTSCGQATDVILLLLSLRSSPHLLLTFKGIAGIRNQVTAGINFDILNYFGYKFLSPCVKLVIPHLLFHPMNKLSVDPLLELR